MSKLTQCLIVKNEEKNLTRALGWGKGIFEEQIVVDTGSTDQTVKIATQLGAKVFDFFWVNDFSAARNFGISKCNGDWIFFLDADEYFEEKDVPALPNLIDKVEKMEKPKSGKSVRYNVIETPWLNLANKNLGVQARVFRNDGSLFYKGAIHEQLAPMEHGYFAVYSVSKKPMIYHEGYMWNEQNDKKQKGARNLFIAKKELERTPESGKYGLFAAEALMFLERYDEADSFFLKAMMNQDDSIWTERMREGYKQWIVCQMHRIKTAEIPELIMIDAVKIYQKAMVDFGEDGDFDLLMSLVFYRGKDMKNSLLFFHNSKTKKNGTLSKRLREENNELFRRLERDKK